MKNLIVFLLLSITTLSYGSVKFYQLSKVHKDGSINISITYSAKKSDVENNKIGNLPFTNEDLKQFFSSPDVQIQKFLVYDDPNDKDRIGATVDFDIRDINKVPEINGLKEMKAYWTKSDSVMVLKWLIPSSFVQSNFIDTYMFLMTFEDSVKSTNGMLKDGKYNWYIEADRMDPNGANFHATVVATEANKPVSVVSEPVKKTEEKTSSVEKDKPKVDNNQKEEKRACGLFGIELPIIIFSGLFISQKYKRNKN